MILLETALKYAERGFSIIPIRPDKKPYIKWEEYQRRRATSEEIKSWWNKWPGAMIGIVTGRISGIVVIDIDTEEGREAIQDYIPDSLIIPTATTPKGGQHLYFKCPEKPLGNNARTIPGCDLRAEGGYIVAPPSVNGTGKRYEWLEGLSIDDVELPALPQEYLDHIYLNINIRASLHQPATPAHLFENGRRDEDLFHFANILVKGGGQEWEIKQALEIFIKSWGENPDQRWINDKVVSALKRAARKERNLTDEIRQWISLQEGYFSLQDIYQSLQIPSSDEKNYVTVVINRLTKEGLVEKYGSKRGVYRPVNKDILYMDYLHASEDEFPVNLSLGLNDLIKLYPGNVGVVAGSKSAGKTALLLNFVHENMHRHEVVYMNSEMGDNELRIRLKLFDDPLESWKFTAIERGKDWADLITDEPKIWIIDFLDLTEDLWKVGTEIKNIHAKLKRGICFIGLQKRIGRDTGHGDTFSMEKARLYLSLDHGRIKITDAKAWRDPAKNPRGLVRGIKIVQGSKIIPVGPWADEADYEVLNKAGDRGQR